MTELSQETLLDLLGEMINRETTNPPGDEKVLADYIVTHLETSPIDFDIKIQEVHSDRPNVIARAGDPTKGSLLLTGHMDVVPATPEDWSGDPFTLRQKDDRVIGRGTADMKGALAAKLMAAEAFLDEHENTGQVILAFTVDEEVGCTGTKALVQNGIEADAAIIGEPTQLDVAIAEYGAVGYELTVSGEGGHSGRPDLAINAIDGLLRVLNQVEALDRDIRAQQNELFTPGATISITEIEGGSAPNIIPDKASATLDWRTLPDNNRKPEYFDEKLADAIKGATLNGVSIDIEFQRMFFSPGFKIDSDTRIVQSTLSAARDVGIVADITGFNAGSDARFLVQAGIPTLLFGPGSIEDDAHTADESVSMSALIKTAETYRDVLKRFLLPNQKSCR